MTVHFFYSLLGQRRRWIDLRPWHRGTVGHSITCTHDIWEKTIPKWTGFLDSEHSFTKRESRGSLYISKSGESKIKPYEFMYEQFTYPVSEIKLYVTSREFSDMPC